jgi:hypothetical protein
MTTIDIPEKFAVPFNRFDFEQQIMECWNVTTDIKTVSEYVMDAPLERDRDDKIANMLIGIQALYEAKFDKLFRQFEILIREHSKTLDAPEWTDEQLDRVAKDIQDWE